MRGRGALGRGGRLLVISGSPAGQVVEMRWTVTSGGVVGKGQGAARPVETTDLVLDLSEPRVLIELEREWDRRVGGTSLAPGSRRHGAGPLLHCSGDSMHIEARSA